MNKNAFPLTTALLVVSLLLSSCSMFSDSWSTPAPAVQATYTLLPTYTPYPTEVASVPQVNSTATLPAPTATAMPAPTNAPSLLAGTLVEALKWTALFPKDNIVIPGAVQIRPDANFDVHIESVNTDAVYQLKTDFDDTDLSTWKDGVRLYEYRVPPGLQPLFIGVQGDTGLQLCWEAEKGGGDFTQILLKTEKGNGTSVLVQFVVVPLTSQPPVGQFCP